MAVNQRPPRHHVVDVGVAVDVGDGGARGARIKSGVAADGLERADRAVDAAGKDFCGAGESFEDLLVVV